MMTLLVCLILMIIGLFMWADSFMWANSPQAKASALDITLDRAVNFEDQYMALIGEHDALRINPTN
jgi:hypothetical protein